MIGATPFDDGTNGSEVSMRRPNAALFAGSLLVTMACRPVAPGTSVPSSFVPDSDTDTDTDSDTDADTDTAMLRPLGRPSTGLLTG